VKVLLATGRPPWPPWRGDQLRARQLVEALAAEHEVTWLAPAAAGEPSPPAGVRRETFRARGAAAAALLALPGLGRGWPLQAMPFRQPELGRRLRELAPRHDLVVLQLARLLPHLADVGEKPLVVDLIDCLSLNAATRARFDRPVLRPLLRWEARRLAAAEARLIAASRASLVVCERDREALAQVSPTQAERIVVAPIAIAAVETPPARDERGGGPTIALTGNLGYFPNRDALRFFAGDVWPQLHRVLPAARLLVAGDRPSHASSRRVAAAGGTLVPRPPDLRALLATATIAVAPLRCGSGVPLKVLDAWAAGVPVVASGFAAAGAAAEPGRDLLVAESAAEWVAQIGRLLADPPLRRRLAEAGRARLAELAPERVYPLLRRLVTGA
jgi:glycosyltransferase involved in cell wall biosynthesis